MQRCTGPAEQKSILRGLSFFSAVSATTRMSSSTPSFFAAEMGTTGMPSLSDRPFISTEPWFPKSSSIIFSASTKGFPISMSCRVRYRLRSIFVASAMFMMTSGFSFIIKSRVTFSSPE